MTTSADAHNILNAYNTLKSLVDSGSATEEEKRAMQTLASQIPDAQATATNTNSLYRGFQHDMTAGLLDEGAGALSYISGNGYKAGRDAVRAKDQAAYAADPQAFDTGQMAGGGTLAGLTMGVGGPVMKGVPTIVKMLMGGGVGGALGANAGIQDAQTRGIEMNGAGDYVREGWKPGLVGVGAGMAAPLVAKMAGGAVGMASKAARGLGNEVGMSNKASRLMANEVGSAQEAGRDIRSYLGTLSPEATLADVPELRPMAMGLAAQNGTGGKVLRKELTDRAAGNGARIEGDMNTHIGQPNAAFDEKVRLANERTGVHGPEYEAALADRTPRDMSGIVGDIRGLRTDAASRVSSEMKAIEAELGVTTRKIDPQNNTPQGVSIIDNGDGTETLVPQISSLKLHNIRSALSDTINAANQAGNKKFAAQMGPVLSRIDAELDTVPGYSGARTGYANTFAMERAIDEGQGALRGGRVSALSPQELEVQFSKLSQPEQDAFRKGLRRDIAGLMGTSKNDAAAAWGEFAKNWNEEKLRLVLGADAEPIIRRLKSEAEFSQTFGRVTSGSDTAIRSEAVKGLAPVAEPGTGRQQPFFSRLKENLIDNPVNGAINSVVYGPRASAANLDLGKMLSATGPERDRILNALLRDASMKPTDEARAALSRRIVETLGFGATGALTSAQTR